MATAVAPCRAAYRALQKVYPAAFFPPVYFAIGGFEVGGNSLAAGVLIGAEMNDPAGIASLVAHEVVHTQQKTPYKYRILLEQCLIEGSTDFIGELISGHVVKDEPYRYAQGRERALWREFVRDQNLGENDSFANWLYGGERPPGRPGLLHRLPHHEGVLRPRARQGAGHPRDSAHRRCPTVSGPQRVRRPVQVSGR